MMPDASHLRLLTIAAPSEAARWARLEGARLPAPSARATRARPLMRLWRYAARARSPQP
ncbi:MAG TPA: hypothetical protein VM370_00495 [Candidatus Thermoplasmatota archaeon]|nr:hypothetical protein [Candidatus Thermoplasmatota archaeon]